MLGPDPISVRGAKKVSSDRVDPNFRLYLEKEFVGGQMPSSLAPAGRTSDASRLQTDAPEGGLGAGVWTAIKRVLFRRPRRAAWATVPRRA